LETRNRSAPPAVPPVRLPGLPTKRGGPSVQRRMNRAAEDLPLDPHADRSGVAAADAHEPESARAHQRPCFCDPDPRLDQL
jgi:hypothetical protein